MARWSFRFFGPFVAEQNGTPLHGFRSDKVRALLAVLAVQPDRPWPRTTLADLLWPDSSERTARANLRNALSNLRHVLGDAASTTPFLTLTDATVAASAAADRSSDVDAFRALLPAADATADGAAEPATVERLTRALALVRGEFLQGFALDSPPFESWLTDAREHWRREATRAARRLACAQALLGDDEAAAAATARWLELEPWDEAGHRHLMRLLARQGRRSAALVQYEACRRRLSDEIGAEPEAATTELAAAIRAAPGEADDAGGLAWPGLSPTPPPDARRALARDPRLLVAWGSCSALTGRGDPFEPFRQAAQMLTGEAEAPPPARAIGTSGARRLWQRLPDTLSALLDHGPDLVDRFVSGRSLSAFARRHGGVDADQRRRLEQLRRSPDAPVDHRFPTALFAQYTAVWAELARHRPLLLLLDDLQWIDPASIDLLFHLAQGLSERRALLVGAYRAEEATPASREGRALHLVVEELLARQGDGRIDLTSTTGRAFVDALLDSEPNALPDGFRTHLHARTSGNPLFTIELLRGMQLRGELRRDGHGPWVAQPNLDWDTLPARVEAVLAHRIDHVSPSCARLLTVGSVEGEAFTAEVAAAVAGMTMAQACGLLSREAGRRHHLVTAATAWDVDGQPIARYRFRHGVLQTYLLQRLDEVERVRLRAEVARALLATRAHGGPRRRATDAPRLSPAP
ncbi:MAG: BTAD domain-containing putative transcriptional regulator [Trueperaceae bacterium]|nr:BTAD domain-containing putative transcriptional regulator [Trueperaceae bacterium]